MRMRIMNNLTVQEVLKSDTARVANLLMCEDLKTIIKASLPKQYDSKPERIIKSFLNDVRRRPELTDVDKASYLSAMLNACSMALEPSLGQCYILPFMTNKFDNATKQWSKRKEAQLIIGYKGFIELAYRSGQVSWIDAECVRAKDGFELELGVDKKLIHKPNLQEENEPVIRVYAICRLKHGSSHFCTMSINEINAIAKYTYQDHIDYMNSSKD